MSTKGGSSLAKMRGASFSPVLLPESYFIIKRFRQLAGLAFFSCHVIRQAAKTFRGVLGLKERVFYAMLNPGSNQNRQ
jgi:hypothetical protein